MTAARRFVIVSGLPASGKTSLARRIGPALGLPVIDKDDVLESLFAERGAGDASVRRRLSRESDVLLERAAKEAPGGAILVSFWHVPGMPAESGTPTDWLADLSAPLVDLHCVCAPDVAARRFARRRRHPGHLDAERSPDEIEAWIAGLARLAGVGVGREVRVDTTEEPDLEPVLRSVRSAWSADGEGGVQ